jgi:chemotaxis protein histidine kinase CheA
MSDFAGMEDLLQDFLQEAGDLLSDVDNKLVDLERSPDDRVVCSTTFSVGFTPSRAVQVFSMPPNWSPSAT